MKKLISVFLVFAVILTMSVELAGMDVKAAQSKSELTSTSVISEKCIMLQFSDGYIDYGNAVRDGKRYDILYNYPLNENNAVALGNYFITCASDPYYAKAKSPVAVDRKTKANGTTRDNEDVKKHSIYLTLPSPLKPNMTYTITINSGSLNCDKSSVTITTDGLQRTDAIHVNQLGYMPQSAAKYAYISSWNGSGGPANLSSYQGKTFNLINKSNHNKIVFTGTIKKKSSYTDIDTAQTVNGESKMYQQNYSVSDVYECDFSSYVVEHGSEELVISVPGIGCSYPFQISKNAYDNAYYTTTRGLYHQRMGIALEKQYTDWYRPTNFDPKTTSFRVHYGSPTGPTVNMENYWGWYADAGDHDGYSEHMSVPRMLMTIYELQSDMFNDNELNIPESGNKIPDILDEAGWLVNFGKRVRTCTPTGGVTLRVFNGALGATDGHTDNFGGSWLDTTTWWCQPENANDTFSYAAAAAQYAYCLQIAGATTATVNEWKNEAISAYAWADEKTDYSNDLKFLAASWLYKLTKEGQYLTDVKSLYNTLNSVGLDISRTMPSNTQWAVFANATNENTSFATEKTTYVNLVKQWADDQYKVAFGGLPSWTNMSRGTAMRVSIYEYMPQVTGTISTPHVIQSIVAYELTNTKKYLNVVQTTADYMLGGNPLNTVWVTGLGDNPVEHAFKVDEHNKINNTTTFQPGIVPYGLHTMSMDDPNSYGGTCYGTGIAWNRSIYPSRDKWPMHEGWFNSRYAILTGEYTVSQNIAPAASVYAYLSAQSKDIEPGVVIPTVEPTMNVTPTPVSTPVVNVTSTPIPTQVVNVTSTPIPTQMIGGEPADVPGVDDNDTQKTKQKVALKAIKPAKVKASTKKITGKSTAGAKIKVQLKYKKKYKVKRKVKYKIAYKNLKTVKVNKKGKFTIKMSLKKYKGKTLRLYATKNGYNKRIKTFKVR